VPESEPQPEPQPEPPSSASDSETHGTAGFCPTCNYPCSAPTTSEGDEHDPVRCPECGLEIRSAAELRPAPLPGALNIIALYGWPVAIAIVASMLLAWPVTWQSQYAALDILVFLFLVALPLCVINGAIVHFRLLRRCTPPSRKGRTFSIGALVSTLFALTVVVPAVLLGGCVLLMIVGAAS